MKDKLKKREIIKNIAIVFLVIMLILTFFSNTIMNRTLPEVKTQGITSGTVSMQVRGEGIVEAEDPYNVTIDETRKVKSVLKHEGDRVEIGDVIYKLEGESGEELTTAKNDLEDKKVEYDTLVLDSGLTKAEVDSVEAGVTATTATILVNLEKKDNEIASLKKKIDEYDVKIADIDRQKSINDTSADPDITSEQKAVDNAQKAYDEAKDLLDKYDALAEATAEVNWYTAQGDNSSTDYNDAVTKKTNAKKAYDLALAKFTFTTNPPTRTDIQTLVNNKQSDLETAQKKKTEKLNSSTSQNTNLAKQRAQLEKEKDEVKVKYDNATKDREDYFNSEKTKINLEKKYQDVLKAEKKVEELEKKAIGGEIKSPVAGTVSSTAFAAGEKIEAGSTVAVIQLDGKGYKLQFPVDAKQAKAVKVGDEVTIVNSWYYGDVSANLVSIQPDKENRRDGKILVFSLNGTSINPGQSLTLSVGQKSSNYDLIVPLSALHGDNDGNFVFILENKATPFGSRYIAKRVDVEVLAKDDKVAAINADLNGWEYVITNSSKDLENKDQVKLAE
ncbi:MAG: HlyD family efflux transporter periplasmic adaptor subunit [Lachnospiraceae bacterium]|nr:HlyD family efflux transporter periplasmic adaptor subunit [Lachnospiraceae bacterium]